MKPVLLVIGMLLMGAGAKAAPKNIHPIAGCSQSDIQSVMAAFAGEAKSPDFDLYIVCTENDWQGFLKDHQLSPMTAALTDWEAGRIFIGPKPPKDSLLLHRTVEHELAHLRCRCKMGER